MDSKIKRRILLFLVDCFAWKILKYFFRKIKFKIINYEVVEKNPRYILSFFHRHLLIPLWILRGRKVIVIISEHFDGEVIARIVLKSGNLTARGSSTRGYIKLIKELLQKSKENNIAITPDGPNGPIYSVSDGLIYLAQKTGLPIIGVAGNFENKIVINSWDNFILPLPFTKSYAELTEPIYYDDNLSFEENKTKIRNKLIELAEKTSIYFPIKRNIEKWQEYKKRYLLVFKILAFLYWLFIFIKNFLYDLKILKKIKYKNLKVILVGNITIGGTGKTQYIEEYIKNKLQDEQVVVLSSGYKSKFNDYKIVKCDNDFRSCGDEPLMLKRNLSNVIVIVAKNRKRMLKMLNQNFKNHYVILDDSFHYRFIEADKNILILDVSKDLFKEKIIPLGLLREPLRNIKRADKIVLNKANFIREKELQEILKKLYKKNKKAEYEKIIYEIEKIYNYEKEEVKIEELKQKRVSVFCGIGNPEFFYQFIKEWCRLDVIDKLFLDDHSYYNADEIAFLKKLAKESDYLLTTEKDFIKLKDNYYINEIKNKIIIIKTKMKIEKIGG